MQEKKYRDELLNKIEKEAHDYERDFHGCSRCVLKPLQDHLNLGDEASLKASTSPGCWRCHAWRDMRSLFRGFIGRRHCHSKRGSERCGCLGRFFSLRVQVGENR